MGTLNSSLDTLFGKLEGFVSTKTVVGEPTNIGGVIIVPLVDVTVGVGAGANDNRGKEDDKAKKELSAGGLGAKITPSAVLVIVNGTVQLVNVKNQESVNKIIDMVPGIVSKLGSLFKKKDKDPAENADEAAAPVVDVTELFKGMTDSPNPSAE